MSCLSWLSTRTLFRWALCLAFCWQLASTGHALPDAYGLGNGQDGPLNVTTANVVINRFATLAASASLNATSITLGNAAGFQVGDLVMIHQAKSGSFSAGDTQNVSLGPTSAGRYELARVTGIQGNVLTLDHALRTAFQASGAQVILVPEYTSVNVQGLPFTGSLTAPAWNGSTGGVLAFLAQGNLTLDGLINLDGRGFRGGATSNNACVTCNCNTTPVNIAFDVACSEGLGRRGESIDSNAGALACGAGNRANGGGGGGILNGGGAGGGNGGFGGAGGDAICTGARAGGFAGSRLVGSLADSLSFGGGGGGGQQNNAIGGAGGAGGGIVWLRASNLLGSGNLRANGSAGGLSGLDGGGGGGAGGSILVTLTGTGSCGAIRAQGGAGSGIPNVGGGGGGGGGRVRLSANGSGVCSVSVSGGPAVSGYTYPAWGGAGSNGINEPCDTDHDTCSECNGGAPNNDGPDSDGDGQCDAGDADDDADGRTDQVDPQPNDPCRPVVDVLACAIGDNDHDGIPNGVECPNARNCPNSDSDNLPDYLDTDSDGDTIPDADECTQSPCENSDSDNLPDYRDPDSDNDGDGDGTDCSRFEPGIHHAAREIVDDGIDQNCDGKELCFDDDDHDGYLDKTNDTRLSDDLDCDDPFEGKRSDPTTDCDDFSASRYPGAPEIIGNELDESCDGKELCFDDDDDDGYLDNSGDVRVSSDLDCRDPFEGLASDPKTDCNDQSALIHPNRPDASCDGIDNDCDGLFDEDGDPNDARCASQDADGDGLPNGLECRTPLDCVESDRDGKPDFMDTDSDGDGTPDATECPNALSCRDSDSDGLPDYQEHKDRDSDGDGTPDQEDEDADDDGIEDGAECDNGKCPDTDGDTIPDPWDGDDQGPGPGDTDGDGRDDAVECAIHFPCEDTDHDQVPDYADLPDAMVDAGVGGPDAGASDAGIDAGTDASTPDASTPDATSPDASVQDDGGQPSDGGDADAGAHADAGADGDEPGHDGPPKRVGLIGGGACTLQASRGGDALGAWWMLAVFAVFWSRARARSRR